MNDFELYGIIIFGVITALQLVYWLVFMTPTCRQAPEYSTTRNTPLSIIICAKNEAHNLPKIIPALFAQKYPKYQVIVVDDCSQDDTLDVLAELKTKYPKLYITSIPIDNKFQHGKKLAVTVGIKAAEYEHLVFIDADCVPNTENWLNEIACRYMDGKSMVIGYGKYEKLSGFLNFYIRYETFWNAVQYFGFAKNMKPFMGVGRNLSYTKTLYNDSSKFRNTYMLASGDDDLFICEKGTRENTAICYWPDSQTVSEPKHTWMEWIAQKSRHFTTSRFYPFSIKTILGTELLTRFLFYVCIVLACVFGTELLLIVAGATFLAREILIYITLGLSAKRMGEKALFVPAILMDILMPLIQAMVYIVGVITKSRNTWK